MKVQLNPVVQNQFSMNLHLVFLLQKLNPFTGK